MVTEFANIIDSPLKSWMLRSHHLDNRFREVHADLVAVAEIE